LRGGGLEEATVKNRLGFATIVSPGLFLILYFLKQIVGQYFGSLDRIQMLAQKSRKSGCWGAAQKGFARKAILQHILDLTARIQEEVLMARYCAYSLAYKIPHKECCGTSALKRQEIEAFSRNCSRYSSKLWSETSPLRREVDYKA
jgi:hypothetical protein